MINNYRARIREANRASYLIIERLDRHGNVDRKLKEIKLVEGQSGRGTWHEIRTRLAGYNLRAVKWELVGGALEARCVTL